jgi:hypothetical protein
MKKNLAVNEKELGRAVELYIKAKEQRMKFVFDYEYRNLFINTCIETGAIKKTELDEQIKLHPDLYIYGYDDTYTPQFGLWVWENIWLKCLDNFDINYFNAIDALSKMETQIY